MMVSETKMEDKIAKHDEAFHLMQSGLEAFNAGRNNEAIEKCLSALGIIEDLYPDDPSMAAVYNNNLAVIYREQREYEMAWIYQNKALDGVTNDPMHPIFAEVLSDLGLLLSYMYTFDEALEYLQSALKMYEAYPTPNYIDIGWTHAKIAKTLKAMKKPEEAMKEFNTALNLLQIHLPPNATPIAEIYAAKGAVLIDLNNCEAALKMLKRALKIYGSGAFAAAQIHIEMASAYSRLGKDAETLESYEKALAIYQAHSSSYRETIFLCAEYLPWCFKKGRTDKVLGHIGDCINKVQQLFLSLMPIFGDELRAHQIEKFRYLPSFIYAMARRHPEIPTTDVYNLLLHTKDIGKEAEIAIREAVSPERHAEEVKLFEQLDDLRKRYRSASLSGAESEKTTLSEKKGQLELKLAPLAREIDFDRLMEAMKPESIASNLPKGSALLEYVCYYDEDHDAEPGTGSFRFAVYLVCRGEIKCFQLGAEQDVNANIYAARERIINPETDDAPSHPAETAELSELYKQLVAPFAGRLDGVEHIYIAPDGELFKIPFELLSDENGVTLSDRFSISYLTSGRDIIRLKNSGELSAVYKTAAVLADPLYDLPDGSAVPKQAKKATPGLSRGFASVTRYDPLPFSRAEAESLEKVFQGEVAKHYGDEARKPVFGEIGSPSIIHVATHGFCFEREEPDEKGWVTAQSGMDAYSNMEDPLTRCGLVFAGANNRLDPDRENPPKDYGDCIFTASDALSLDLRGTDLLVLSACQTGLGEVMTGDGVRGLRRAFELAGVNSLLCTLWSVDDVSSAILMERFYTNLLVGGMDKLSALTAAKNSVRNISKAEALKYYRENGFGHIFEQIEAECNAPIEAILEETPFKHPYYWAGYVLQGSTT